MSHIRTASKRRISYDESGTGPPVLLIPGHGGYRRGCLIWLAEALAPRFRVVAMDNRDAGESEPETEYYGLADMAGDAAALLDGLGIDRAHVLGHSMGAAIALQLALDHPTRVDRLVLVSPTVGGEPGYRVGEPLPPPDAWWVDDPVERTHRVLPVVVGPDYRSRMSEAEVATIAELERGNRTTWAGMMRREAAAAGDDQILSRLAEIRTPTLVIHGDADVPFRSSRAKHWPPAFLALDSSCSPGSVTGPGWSAPMWQTARSWPSSPRRASRSCGRDHRYHDPNSSFPVG